MTCGFNETSNATCSAWNLVGTSLTLNNYTTNATIFDSTTNSTINVTNPLDGWTTNIATPGYYTCAGVQVFGGYGIFGNGAWARKSFTSLPLHNSIRL